MPEPESPNSMAENNAISSGYTNPAPSMTSPLYQYFIPTAHNYNSIEAFLQGLQEADDDVEDLMPDLVEGVAPAEAESPEEVVAATEIESPADYQPTNAMMAMQSSQDTYTDIETLFPEPEGAVAISNAEFPLDRPQSTMRNLPF